MIKRIIFTAILLSVTFLASAQTKQAVYNQLFSAKGKTVTVYTTAVNSSYRLTQTDKLGFIKLARPTEGEMSVFVDPNKIYPTFLGIGAALTDASAETFAKLPFEKRQEILHACFNKDKGIGYTLARTNIHSCVFSSSSYIYVAEGDSSLKSFSISHDMEFRILFIKQAIAAAGGTLTLYASPWSPPSFMKTNNEMLHGGKLKNEYAQRWANYFVKFIKAYETPMIWQSTNTHEN